MGLLSTTAPAGTGNSSGDSGQSSSGDSSSGQSTSGDTSSGQSSSGGGSGYISGVITSASSDSITITGDDGNSYTIYTGSADISASSGLDTGTYVNVGYTVNSDGTISASAVTG